MPSQQIEGRRKLRPTIALWMLMAWIFGLLAGAAYRTKWLAVSFAIATAFCLAMFLVRFLGWYWHELLGWLWRRAVKIDRSN
jgi:predicted Na+-dependent transporter